MAAEGFDKQDLLNRAIACGQWMIANQVTDRMDANRGRSIRFYDADTEEMTRTGNWMTGTMASALIALWARTGDEQFREGAIRAGRYILSLQVRDRDAPFFGAIREITPQSIEFAPRDATSAAWGLVWLAQGTGESLYLDRARLFADWLIDRGMYRGWPIYAVYMDPKLDNFYSRGSFQSGAGLFFHDLFQMTGDQRYIERGLLPIATIYRDDFITDSGKLVLDRDPFTGAVTAPLPGDTSIPQHALNDDYGALMMLAASRLFGDRSFVEKAARFALWLTSMQDEDGGFAGGEHPSAVPVGTMLCRDIGEELADSRLLKSASMSLNKLLSMQFLQEDDPRLRGAFRGRYEGSRPESGGSRCANMRTTGYSLMALLKAESDLSPIWLGAHNPPFEDHRWTGAHDLVW